MSVSAACRDTALHDASSNGHTESVKALLEKGAAVNAENKDKCAFACLLYWMCDDCTCRQRPCGRLGSWVSSSAPCRDTALHLASHNGDTESVKALLEKGAAVNAENRSKCAFSCVLELDGRWLQAPSIECAVRLVVERVGAMQEHGAAPCILERPHGEREGAAREGRGGERRGQREVRVYLFGWATAARAGKGCAPDLHRS
jgi:hypothetical protein